MTPEPPVSSGVKPTRALALTVMTALGGWIVVELVWAVANLQRAGLVASTLQDLDGANLAAMADNEDLVNVLSVAQLAVTLVTAAIFITWLFRARANADVITDFPHAWGRPWFVLGWVIPIVNLWIPRQIIGDLWLASDPGSKRWFLKTPPLVLFWWLLFILYWLASRLVGRLLGSETRLEGLRDQAYAYVALAPIGIVAAGLAGLVVWRISRLQENHAVRIAAALG